MQVVDHDWIVRQHAFRFLEELTAVHGDVLPWKPLQEGFELDGRRVTLIGARGIWKPASIDLPISITTSWKDPYGDEADERGLLQYRYYGTDPAHPTTPGSGAASTKGARSSTSGPWPRAGTPRSGPRCW